jgi:leucyl-tRNA synthetase
MMSDSPPERDMEWTSSGVEGASRFLNRIFKLSQSEDDTRPFADTGSDAPADIDSKAEALIKITHHTIRGITEDIERFRFNRAVAALHSLNNAITACDENTPSQNWARRFSVETLARLIAPIAPHIAEEMWHHLGHDDLLANQPWPEADDAWLVVETIAMPVQINGKLRGTLDLPPDTDKAKVEEEAMKLESVIKHLNGQNPKKIIVVPNRIVNVVV